MPLPIKNKSQDSKISLRRTLTAGLTALALFLPSQIVHAQDSTFPNDTVRLIVTTAAGASSDTLTRAVAAQLSKDWGVSVLVENVVGASGAIGLRQVADAEPNGYTIVANGTSLPLSVALGADLPYDPLEDFRGVTQAVVNPQILVVHPNLGVSNWEEYVELVREKDGTFLQSGLSIGSIAHLLSILIAEETDTRITNIPFQGGAPATVALLGENVDAIIITLAAVTEHVRNGSLVPIAVSSPERSPALPDVPTLRELGLDIALESWQGFLIPAGVPDDIAEKLTESFVAAIRNPEVAEFLENQGYGVAATTGDELDTILREEIELFSRIVESAGIEVEQ